MFCSIPQIQPDIYHVLGTVLSFKDIKLSKSQALPLKSYPEVSGYGIERDTQLG